MSDAKEAPLAEPSAAISAAKSAVEPSTAPNAAPADAAKVARSVQAHVSRALRGASADTRRDVIDACVAALRALELEEPIPAPPTVATSPSLAPPARATPHHLVFLVHGMGRHDDFDDAKQLGHDGKPGTGGGNAEFREALDAALGGRGFKDLEATRVAVRSVEWHSLLRSAGLEKVLDACCPSGVPELRDFAKQNLLDILLFSSTDKAQALVDGVVSQLAQKRAAYVAEHPGWSGAVHIVAHSLGSVLIFDILSRAGRKVDGIRYPPLPFEVECFVAIGSPVAGFVAARQRQRDDDDDGDGGDDDAPRPRCAAYFNVVNPFDPVAYLAEPWMRSRPPTDGLLVQSPGTRLWLRQQLASDAPRLLEPLRVGDGATLLEALQALAAAERRGATDFHLPAKRSVLSDTLNAGSAHGSYWTSADLASFVLAQMLAPWAAELLAEATAAAAATTAEPESDGVAAIDAAVRHRLITPPAVDPCAPILLVDHEVQLLSETTGLTAPALALLQGGWLVVLAPDGAPLPKLNERIALEGATVRVASSRRVTIEVAGGAKHELAAADDAELAEWLAAIAGARGDGVGGADGDEAGGESAADGADPDGTADEGEAAADEEEEPAAEEPARGAYFGAQRVGVIQKRRAGGSLVGGWRSRWLAVLPGEILVYDRSPDFSHAVVAMSVADATLRAHEPTRMLSFAAPDGAAITLVVASTRAWLDAVQRGGLAVDAGWVPDRDARREPAV